MCPLFLGSLTWKLAISGRSAAILLHKYGDGAEMYARHNADEALQNRNNHSCTIWKHVAFAVSGNGTGPRSSLMTDPENIPACFNEPLLCMKCGNEGIAVWEDGHLNSYI